MKRETGSGEPLTPERQRLVVLVSGTVAAIATNLCTKVGKRWFEDLRAAGYQGAVQAAMVYDFTSETNFEGFAWGRILGAMIDFLRKESKHLPAKLADVLGKVVATLESTSDYAAEVRDSGDDDVEEDTEGFTATTGVAFLCLGAPPSNPERALLREENIARMNQALSRLSERDGSLIRRHYFEGWTFKKIATHLGIHEATVRSRHKAAMRRFEAIFARTFLGK